MNNTPTVTELSPRDCFDRLVVALERLDALRTAIHPGGRLHPYLKHWLGCERTSFTGCTCGLDDALGSVR